MARQVQRAIAETLGVSERAVEKHSNAIFSKLGLSEERDVNRRVKAVLVYLSAQSGASHTLVRVHLPGLPVPPMGEWTPDGQPPLRHRRR